MKSPEVVTVTVEELQALKQRVECKNLLDSDYELITQIAETLLYLRSLLEKARLSVKRLRRMLFGPTTETSAKLDPALSHSKHEGGRDGSSGSRTGKAKGHGRTPSSAYWGANTVRVDHDSLQAGQRCPACARGNLYELETPARIICLVATPPVTGTVFECERLRCALCGQVFTADPPEAARGPKYDETVSSIIALLKYGNGMPFYRLAQLQKSLGVPLAASVQWKLVREKAAVCEPIHDELVRLAAQAYLMHSDDTRFTILELLGERPSSLDAEAADEEHSGGNGRTGVYTTAILSRLEDRQISLYRTGAHHAGENVAELLKQRPPTHAPPILMCDALSHNLPKGFQVLLANCMSHARRPFVELLEAFPHECGCVLETFRYLYFIDERASRENLSAQERLELHQRLTGSLMEGLSQWLHAQFEQKRVEPNSGMGEAIRYLIKHWEALTLFLRVPGAPIDNNICEQTLKRAILSRKNSLFYKTLNGARVGDRLMGLIHTCVLNKVNPFKYLTEIHKHAREVAANPSEWLPWNYLSQIQTR